MAAKVVVTIAKGTTVTRDYLVELYADAIKARYAEQLKEKQPALRDQAARMLAERLLAAHMSCQGGHNEVVRRIVLSNKTDEECREVERIMADLVLIREVDHLVLPTFVDKIESLVKHCLGKAWSLIEQEPDVAGSNDASGVRG